MSLREAEQPTYDWQKLSETDRTDIKRDRMRLVTLLELDGAKVPQSGKFLCPYHNDKNPSAEIRECPSGYYFVCYACSFHMDYFALTAHRENIPVGRAFKAETSSLAGAMSYLSGANKPVEKVETIEKLVEDYLTNNPNVVCEEVNRYTDPEDNSLTFCTVRVVIPGKGKRVFQASYTDRGWEFKGPQGQLPIYNRTGIKDVENVLIVEGEKCVHRFIELGLDNWAATTSAGGSKAANRADWAPCAGKNVVIWRDADSVGLRYQDDVIDALRSLNPRPQIRIVDVDQLNLEEGGDIVDHLDRLSLDRWILEIEGLLEEAEVWNNLTNTRKHLIDVHTGKVMLISLPNVPVLSRLTQLGVPGALTAISGAPGSAKSFFVMEAGWMLHEEGVPTSTLFLEDGDVDYHKRCIAQMAGFSGYTNWEWQQNNAEQSMRIFSEVGPRVSSYFDHVTCVKAKIMTQADVLDWIRDQVDRGYRVIIIDPVTAMLMTNMQWIDDQKFVLTAQNIVEDGGASLIYTTHPKPGSKGKASLDGMAGGQAWARFSHTNIWIRHFQDGPQMSRVGEFNGQQDVVEHRREGVITKARHGEGTFGKVAIDLDVETLRFREYGILLGKAERQMDRLGPAPIEGADF